VSFAVYKDVGDRGDVAVLRALEVLDRLAVLGTLPRCAVI